MLVGMERMLGPWRGLFMGGFTDHLLAITLKESARVSSCHYQILSTTFDYSHC
jgi:hypothetical protein